MDKDIPAARRVVKRLLNRVELINSDRVLTPSVMLPYFIDLIISTREPRSQRSPEYLLRQSGTVSAALANQQSQ